MNNNKTYVTGMWHGVIITLVILIIPISLMFNGVLKAIDYINAYAEHYNFEQIETDYSKKEALERKFELLINSGIKYDYFGFRDEDKCNDIAAKAIMMMLDDDYAAYYTPDEASSLLSNSLGSYKGIGITISLDSSSNRCVIINVADDSSADKAGIKAGDIIVKVGNTVAERLNTSEISKLIHDADDTLNLTVSRAGNLQEITVKKTTIVEQHIKYNLVNENIGYINLDEFNGKCVVQMKWAIQDLQKQSNKLKGYIIDLRGNPGGQLDETVSLVGYFTGKDKLATYLTDKDNRREEYYTDKESLIDEDSKIVILVNSASASASEMFTGALQDTLRDRVKVVGTNTFGKGIAQEIFRLQDGSVIKYTVGEYFTPEGRKVNEIGITPDIEVYNSIDDNTDRQYNKAVETLESMINKEG